MNRRLLEKFLQDIEDTIGDYHFGNGKVVDSLRELQERVKNQGRYTSKDYQDWLALRREGKRQAMNKNAKSVPALEKLSDFVYHIWKGPFVISVDDNIATVAIAPKFIPSPAHSMSYGDGSAKEEAMAMAQARAIAKDVQHWIAANLSVEDLWIEPAGKTAVVGFISDEFIGSTVKRIVKSQRDWEAEMRRKSPGLSGWVDAPGRRTSSDMNKIAVARELVAVAKSMIGFGAGSEHHPAVKRVLQFGSVADIGQFSRSDKAALERAVEDGVLQKGKGGGYPALKWVYAVPGLDIDRERRKMMVETMMVMS